MGPHMTARSLGRVLIGVLCGTVASGVVAVVVVKRQLAQERAAHVAPLRVLVNTRATRSEVRERLRDPPFIASPKRRRSQGQDLLSFWAMSPSSRDRIERGLNEHPETWVYWGTCVDFLFFDASGRVASYETISN